MIIRHDILERPHIEAYVVFTYSVFDSVSHIQSAKGSVWEKYSVKDIAWCELLKGAVSGRTLNYTFMMSASGEKTSRLTTAEKLVASHQFVYSASNRRLEQSEVRLLGSHTVIDTVAYSTTEPLDTGRAGRFLFHDTGERIVAYFTNNPVHTIGVNMLHGYNMSKSTNVAVLSHTH